MLFPLVVQCWTYCISHWKHKQVAPDKISGTFFKLQNINELSKFSQHHLYFNNPNPFCLEILYQNTLNCGFLSAGSRTVSLELRCTSCTLVASTVWFFCSPWPGSMNIFSVRHPGLQRINPRFSAEHCDHTMLSHCTISIRSAEEYLNQQNI